jgi:hypothetical protein
MAQGVCERTEEAVHLIADRKQESKETTRDKKYLQRNIPSDLLPPTRPYLLKVPEPPKQHHCLLIKVKIPCSF